MRRKTGVLSFAFFAVLVGFAGEPVDLDMVTRIRDEAFNRSQVMEITSHLTETIGPRLTGSPNMKTANEWTRDKMASWGLAAKVEPWGEFGAGWSFSHAAVHMTVPHQTPLIALPKAWTPGTDGPVQGPVMSVEFSSEKDLERQRGKLKGVILLIESEREINASEKPPLSRYSEEELAELMEYSISKPRRQRSLARIRKRIQLREKLNDFLVEEGVLATIETSSWSGGVVRVGGGGSREIGKSRGVPALVMASEHYHRISRLLERGQRVELEIDVRATFYEDDLMGYNTIGEFPGADKGDEIVMAGAHLDSWHAGTGATDNASSCAVMMEAVRILKALNVKPRRTIRIGLWSGEEQGLLGSRGYVAKHFAYRPEPEDPEQRKLPSFLRENPGPLNIRPDHARLSVYFNLDNGSGRIRGIYAQENAAAQPIYEAWLRPFHDLGAKIVTQRNTRGTDHLSFDSVGLPGFQFIQDELNYFTQTHHTNLDTLDYVPEEDLIQASAIMASFLYHAAMREAPMPRKPMPPDPEPSKTKAADADNGSSEL